MIDTALFWSLGGPSAFVRHVVETANRYGFAAVQVPSYHPPGLVEALVAGFEEAGLAPVHRVAAETPGSAVHRMATSAGIAGSGMRTVGAFFELPTLKGSMFLVDGMKRSEWPVWAPFFRSFVAERRRREEGILLPTLVALIPPETPRRDVDRLFPGALLTWRDRVSSFDVRTYVNRRLGRSRGADLLDAVSSEVVIGLAGYDPVLAHILCDMEPEDAIDPWEHMRRQYGSSRTHPHWGNGLVDYVDGQVFVHTAALVAAGDRRSFDVRRWRAVTGPVLDFNGTVCRHFADTHAELLEPRLPYTVQTPAGAKTIDHRYGLENKHLRELLAGTLEIADESLMRTAAKARNDVAHNQVPAPSLVARLSRAWAAYSGGGTPVEARGWYWPRCGQRLVLMVGPSGGGKSTWARANHSAEEIVSTDDIRTELFGSLVVPGSQRDVHDTAARRVVDRLSRGEGAVHDATNIKRKDRLAVVDLAPADLEVVYVVVDRPIEVKRADGGWRNEREGLLDGHAEMFAAELPAVLAGDGRANVKVVDAREPKCRIGPRFSDKHHPGPDNSR